MYSSTRKSTDLGKIIIGGYKRVIKENSFMLLIFVSDCMVSNWGFFLLAMKIEGDSSFQD